MLVQPILKNQGGTRSPQSHINIYTWAYMVQIPKWAGCHIDLRPMIMETIKVINAAT